MTDHDNYIKTKAILLSCAFAIEGQIKAHKEFLKADKELNRILKEFNISKRKFMVEDLIHYEGIKSLINISKVRNKKFREWRKSLKKQEKIMKYINKEFKKDKDIIKDILDNL